MPASRRAALAVCLLLAGFLNAGAWDDGKEAFARQDWKAAVTALNRFLLENPGAPEAPAAAFLRGVALYQLADYRGSLDAFQKLERTWPQSSYAPRLPYWKGSAALAAGQNALAERELAAQAGYPDQEPFTTRALLGLGLARVALGKPDAAVEALKAFTATSREADLLAQAWATWADLDRQAGRTDQALERYRLAWQAHPGDRWDLWSRIQALDLLASMKRWEECRALLAQASALFPGEKSWEQRRVAVAQGLGDGPGLLKALEAAWAKEPDPKKKQELASNRARTGEDQGKPDPGWWLKASQGPDAALGGPAILRYAFLLESAGRQAEAAQALEGWAARPGLPLAFQEPARHRAAQDRWVTEPSKAVPLWDKLLADFPKSPRVPGWLLSRARVRLDQGDTTKALADLARLLKEYPKAEEAPEARYQTGLVYLKRQEPARAEAWFYGLVEELKTGDLYQRALLARGLSFVNAGKTELAQSSLQRLIREAPLGPWVGEAWAALGRNALQAGLLGEAANAFEQAEATLTDEGAKAKALWSRAEALAAVPNAEAASGAFRLYAERYPAQGRASEALYRQGAVFASVKDWARAVEVWSPLTSQTVGAQRAAIREGLATALVRLGRPADGWAELEALEKEGAVPEAWYRWGLAATAQGEAAWADQAFQYLLQHHPDSPVAEAALPRAAGALLTGGQSQEALNRYADYFLKHGKQPSSAPVAKAAATVALAYPATLEALIQASRSWNLAPEVAAEFALVWAQSRLDADSEAAQGELRALSEGAPWGSQRSDALLILGKWHRDRGRLPEAKTLLEAAAAVGDDLSVFKARWALAQVTEATGDLAAAARQRESAEKSAGPGVPLEFRVQLLREASETWTKAGRGDEASRVLKRVQALTP